MPDTQTQDQPQKPVPPRTLTDAERIKCPNCGYAGKPSSRPGPDVFCPRCTAKQKPLATVAEDSGTATAAQSAGTQSTSAAAAPAPPAATAAPSQPAPSAPNTTNG